MSTLDAVLAETPIALEYLCNKFLANTVETDTGCLEWQGARTSAGYGHAKMAGHWVDIHVFIAICFLAWTPEEREELRGLLVRHTCDNPPCINPEHLVFGTKADNAFDAVSRTAWYTGPLTTDQVIRIRELYAMKDHPSQATIAKMFGIDQVTVSGIVRGRLYARR